MPAPMIVPAVPKYDRSTVVLTAASALARTCVSDSFAGASSFVAGAVGFVPGAAGRRVSSAASGPGSGRADASRSGRRWWVVVTWCGVSVAWWAGPPVATGRVAAAPGPASGHGRPHHRRTPVWTSLRGVVAAPQRNGEDPVTPPVGPGGGAGREAVRRILPEVPGRPGRRGPADRPVAPATGTTLCPPRNGGIPRMWWTPVQVIPRHRWARRPVHPSRCSVPC